MTAGPRIDHYDWAGPGARGGREAMLRFGPDDGPLAIVAPPLFEEANRTRAFLVRMLRALAGRGVGGALPDLPGIGESSAATEEASLADWRSAFAAAAAHLGRPHIASLRSGALLTRAAAGASRWLVAPQDGAQLVDELGRIARLGGAGALPLDAPGPAHRIAGNALSRALLRDLHDATPDRSTPSRLVRLASDLQPADHKFLGSPLWRRAEPGDDPVLAASLADDLVRWIARCDD